MPAPVQDPPRAAPTSASAYDPPARTPSAYPQQGVIEEARRRQRRRQLRLLTIASAALASLLGLALSDGGSSSVGGHRPTPRLAPRAGTGLAPPRPSGPIRLQLVPPLNAGELGWEYVQTQGGQLQGSACCGFPTHVAEIDIESQAPSSGAWWTGPVIASPGVAAVSVEGRKPVPTKAGLLPYALRFAVVHYKHRGASLLAFDERGQRLGSPGWEPLPKRREFEDPHVAHSWNAPAQAPPGPCELSVSGIEGLATEGGESVSHVKGYRVFGSPAFQSCADTYYSFDDSSLEAAVLLDAEHPGASPAPLPGMRPLAGERGVFDAPGSPEHGTVDDSTNLTAERVPGAWLVVAYGKNPAQQLELLRHMHAKVHL